MNNKIIFLRKKIIIALLTLILMCGTAITAYSQTSPQLGDTNNDKTVNIVDALIIAQFYVGIKPAVFFEETADVSGDKQINIVDALLIAQYYVQIIDKFPGSTSVVTPTPTPVQTGSGTEPNFSLVGYGSKATGGSGGKTVKVSNSSAFGSAVSGSEKRIVILMNKISWGGQIGSNKTIIGYKDKGMITGGTVRLGSNNILRNLTIHSGKKGKDLVGIYGAKNIWIDHCEVYNYFGDLNGDGKIDTKGDIGGGDIDMYDGIIDITGSSGDITISWSIIHDGFKAMLKSAGGNLTFHHNEFYNSWERVPSFNGGKGHLFNNYFHDITQYCINIRKGAQARVEGNVFEKVGNGTMDTKTGFARGPIGTYYSQGGCWEVSDNLYIDCKGNQPAKSTCTVVPPYEFTSHLQASSAIKDIVTKWAGPGKIDIAE